MGKEFIDLVFFLQEKLPKSMNHKAKSIDILIIASIKHKEEFTNLNRWKKVKYSYPIETLSPNLAAVKEAKVIVAIIDEDINKCEKSIFELKFAALIGTRVMIIEDSEIHRLNNSLKDIAKAKSNEFYFKGIEYLSNKKFKKKLKSEIKKAYTKGNEGSYVRV